MNRLIVSARALASVLVLGACSAAPAEHAEGGTSSGYVLRAGHGERIFGSSLIKASPETGSSFVSMVLFVTPHGESSGVHMHERADQIVYVTRGSGVALLGQERNPISTGDVVFVPRGVWHEFAAGDDGMEAIEVFAPAGQEKEFREVDRVTDGGTRALTLEELNRITSRFGSLYRESTP